MSELGPVSKDHCDCVPLNFFHPYPGVEIEIHEPDEHGVGDILIATTLYGGYRLEGYASGDVGRIRAEKCPCGEAITFEVIGRRGFDFIKLAGALLVRAEFDRVMAMFRSIQDYRVEASTTLAGDFQGALTIRLYSKEPPTEQLRREIEASLQEKLFLTQTNTLANLVARGAFKPPVFDWTHQPFPESAKSIKLQRV
ncbi:MAG: hypothetical protein WA021_03845 [Minisyncoccia bacterium]